MESEGYKPESGVEKYSFTPGPETLKLIALNRALQTGNHELIHEVQSINDNVEIVENDSQDFGPNKMTKNQYIKLVKLPEEYLEEN